jgi:hypothetical protein
LSRLSKDVEAFKRRVDRLLACCKRVETHLSAGTLGITDTELVYSSSFLSICCQWEGLLEQALLEAVCGSPSGNLSRQRLGTFRSKKHFRRALLHPNKDYIGLESLSKAIGLAKLYLPDGRPFSSVSASNQTYLGHCVLIRNAIAHQSDHAVIKFRSKVPGIATLPVRRRTPSAFLRHVFRQNPSQTRMDLYAAAFKSAATEIGAAW